MALRDWLNPEYNPLSTENPAICSKSDLKITGITTVTSEITSPVIPQVTENKVNNPQESQNHKNHSHNVTELKKQGLKRLAAAGQGLPVTLNELAAFFANDLQSFGAGEVKQAGLRKACEWYAFTHMNRSVYWWDSDKPKNVVSLDEYRRSIR